MTDGAARHEPSADAPLDSSRFVTPPGGWNRVDILESSPSTNVELSASLRGGQRQAGDVVVTTTQTAGRGRHGRAWTSPGGSLAVSLAVDVPESVSAGWVPLITGVGVVEAIASAVPEAGATLKWPNDVLTSDGRKLAGILAELVEPGLVVVGIGLNVNITADDLPVETATSLAIAGGRSHDRTEILAGLLEALGRAFAQWRTDPNALADRYRSMCDTIGRAVVVSLPGDSSLTGTVAGIDPDGRLVVDPEGPADPVVVAAGDVTHVRPTA